MIAQAIAELQALESYPDYQYVYGQAEWARLHEAVAFAVAEALLRFPHAPEALSWTWDRCYYLAISTPGGEGPESPELLCYGPLIASALNAGETTPLHLVPWFTSHEPRIAVDIVQLQVPQPAPSSWLISLGTEPASPQAFMLLSYVPDSFTVQPLASYLMYLRMASGDFSDLDFTGDGFPELQLTFAGDYCCGFFTHNLVFDLHAVPAHQLTFLSEGQRLESLIHMDSGWISPLLPADDAYPGLLYATIPHDPYSAPCNFSRLLSYHWDGVEFVSDSVMYRVDPLDPYDEKAFCDEALPLLHDQGDIALAANVLSYARDGLREEFLYRLGEDRARRGQVADAREVFLYLLDGPGASTFGDYSSSAQEFLDTYHSAQDYYTTCAAVSICDARAAVSTIVAGLPPTAYYSVLEELRSHGVPVLSEGLLDLDADGLADLWAVIRHPGQTTLEYWVFLPRASAIHAIYVGDVASLRPSIRLASGPGLPPQFSLADFTLFSIVWTNDTPTLLTASPPSQSSNPPWPCITRYSDIVSELSRDLLEGGNPSTVTAQLLRLEDDLPSGCAGTTPPPQYLYALGLAAELAGDEPLAVESYTEVWIEYPTSPFTVLARTKLELVP